MRISSVLSAALVLGLSTVAFADKVTEPATGFTFDSDKTIAGKSYTLVGVGVRKKFFVKVYAMGLYVDTTDGKRAFSSLATKAGGSDQAHLTAGGKADSFIIWGQFDKLAILHFVRDVSADKVREAFTEGLADEVSDKAPADVREAATSFLKLIDRDLKNGDDLVLHSDTSGRLEVSIGGQNKGGVQNAKLARAMWNVYLGGKPPTKELKADLTNRISELGK
ncbi:MAG: chalcone isomerase family protein [Polyangia bacterium]